jgi:hypothetical protein
MLFVYVGANPLPEGKMAYMRAADVNETPALLASLSFPPPSPVRDGAA